MTQRHELPTHLNVADKAFGGLTMRQLLSGAVGLALAYGAANDLPLVLAARFGIAGVVLLATLLLVLWQPAGRPLEDWVFVLLRYYASPRIAVWRPREARAIAPSPREVVLRALASPHRDEESGRTGREEAMGSTHSRKSRLASAQELLPLEEIVGDLVRLRGSECRAVLEAGSVNFALKSETEQDAILAGYRRFLNGLAYPLQVLVRVKPTDVEGYVGGLRDARSASEAVQRLARDHEAFVRRIARERTLLDRRFFVVVPGGAAGATHPRSSGLRWPWGPRDDGRALEFLATRRLLAFRCGEIAQGLAAFGVSTRSPRERRARFALAGDARRFGHEDERARTALACGDRGAAAGGHRCVARRRSSVDARPLLRLPTQGASRWASAQSPISSLRPRSKSGRRTSP